MKAYCLQKHPQIYQELEVFEYENCYVAEIDYKPCPYQVFTKTDKKAEDIEDGYMYGYYFINGELYDSYLTNDYKAVIPKSKGYTQLSLF